jgi:hypothetical protein
VKDRSTEAVAWCAALFEGEGYIYARQDGGTEIGLEMVDEDVVRKFHALVGCGNVTSRPARGKWQTTFTWRASERWDVADVLRTLRPCMGRRRGSKADDAMVRIRSRFH